MSGLSIVRPINGIMGFLSTYISAFIAIGYAMRFHLLAVTLAAISVFLVTSGGNIINDIVDIDTDRLNHPDRPLVTGKMTVKTARILASLFFIVPVIISFFISYVAMIVVIAAILLLIVYEVSLKRRGLSGNFVISLLIGAIFVFGGVAVNSYYRMIFLFILAFFSNMSREIIKDVQDVGGDKDRLTFPKVHGVKNSLRLSNVFIAILVICSFIPYFLKILSLYYFIIVIAADAIFILSGVLSARNAGRGQQVSKYAMIIGMVSFLAGAFK
ncbi:MAG: UbiA family prenyltransferase [Thermoplasmata archaeon]